MATMNVSLPAPMKDWVEKQAASGRYANASDYVRDLIRADLERSEKMAHMEKLIDEAYASGVSTRTMADIRRDALKQLAKEGITRDVAAE